MSGNNSFAERGTGTSEIHAVDQVVCIVGVAQATFTWPPAHISQLTESKEEKSYDYWHSKCQRDDGTFDGSSPALYTHIIYHRCSSDFQKSIYTTICVRSRLHRHRGCSVENRHGQRGQFSASDIRIAGRFGRWIAWNYE